MCPDEWTQARYNSLKCNLYPDFLGSPLTPPPTAPAVLFRFQDPIKDTT